MKTKYLIIFMGLIIAGLILKDAKGGLGEWVRDVEKAAVTAYKSQRTERVNYKAKITGLSFWEGKEYKRSNRSKFVKRGIKGNFKALGCRMKLGHNLCDRDVFVAWYKGGE